MSDPRTSRTGRGLLRPFRREHNDFASGTGAKLLMSNVRGVLGVQRGEYRHRGDFGSRLVEVLHTAPAGIEGDAAAIYAAMDVERWEPRVYVETGRTELERDYTRPGRRRLRLYIGDSDEPGEVDASGSEEAYHEVIA